MDLLKESIDPNGIRGQSKRRWLPVDRETERAIFRQHEDENEIGDDAKVARWT